MPASFPEGRASATRIRTAVSGTSRRRPGALKIAELRDRSRAALGERFDLRRFHMAVLDTGAVPLRLLEQRIDEWVAAEGRGALKSLSRARRIRPVTPDME